MVDESGTGDAGEPGGHEVEPEESVFHRRSAGDEPAPRWLEIGSAVLLSITVVLTAWSAFESSKWGGAMSISFSQASTARIEANRAATEVAQSRQSDLTIYSVWFQERVAKDAAAATYVEQRFTPWFRVAFDEWVAQGGLTNKAGAAKSPFALPSYVPPGTDQEKALDVRADSKYQQALRNNQRGDNYTILGVLFAVVLFFSAMATRFTNRAVQLGMMGFASVTFVVGVVFLLSFPKLV